MKCVGKKLMTVLFTTLEIFYFVFSVFHQCSYCSVEVEHILSLVHSCVGVFLNLEGFPVRVSLNIRTTYMRRTYMNSGGGGAKANINIIMTVIKNEE